MGASCVGRVFFLLNYVVDFIIIVGLPELYLPKIWLLISIKQSEVFKECNNVRFDVNSITSSGL